MLGSITFTGMVLSTMPVLDYDRRIVVLSTQMGKLAAFARSARKPNSHLVGATQPFVLAEFEAYQGKNSITITKARVIEHFEGITSDLDKLWLGSYFLEVADYFAIEGGYESDRLKLLYQSLKALDSGEFDPKLIRMIYELKTMVLNGEFIDVNHKSCEGLSESGKYTLDYINKTSPESLYSFKLDDKLLDEMIVFSIQCKKRFFKHEFNAEAFLEL